MLENCWCSELHAPSIICFIQFIPFCAVFLAHLHLILVTPGHSSSLHTPFPGLCSAVSGVSPLDSGILGISPPQPQGCAPALSGAATTLLQPYLAKPYLCIMGCHSWRQELQPLALLPSRSLAQSKPRAGCDCSGWGASHREDRMGASLAGEPGPSGIFLGFFPPHSNAQNGRITTVR